MFVASFCSDSEELTNRRPCRFVGQDLKMRGDYSANEGVADRVAVWCAGCGDFVELRMLRDLLVFSNGRMTRIVRPLVPMFGEWGEA